MGLLEDMEEESDCIEAKFQEFIASKSKKNIFLFFEGKDDYKYYSCRLTAYIGANEYGVFHCNCKNNVLKVQEMISQQAKIEGDEKILYFIDRDYDNDLQVPDNIYVTSAYSIENYYFSDSAIKRILIGVIGFSEENEEDKLDFKKVFEHVINKRNKIIEEIIFANALYSIQIRKSSYCKIFPRLTNVKDYNVVKEFNQISDFKSKVDNFIDTTDKEVYEEIKALRENPVNNLRGKYFVQALTPIFKTIFQDANKKDGNRAFFSKRRKVRMNLSDILCEFSAFADTPSDLDSYIKEKFSSC